VVGYVNMSLLQIHRLIFGEVMGKSLVYFLTHGAYFVCFLVSHEFICMYMY